MKSILCLGTAALLFCLVGCQTRDPAVIVPKLNPDPVDFAWIKSSEEVKLATVDIYFHGKADGKYTGSEKWVGVIAGDMFFKLRHSKYLTDGLFIENCTVQVNEDSSIKIVAPKDAFWAAAKKITFENDEVAVWYANDTFRFKGGRFFYSTTSIIDGSLKNRK